MTLDLSDVLAADREERWLKGLTGAARAAYFELVSVRDARGNVETHTARAAVRASLEVHYVAVDHQIEILAGRVAVGGAIQPAAEHAAKARAQQVAGTARVLTELDERGHIRVGIAPGTAWRVWTADEADEAEEIFG